MGRDTASSRVERALSEAEAAREEGRAAEALPRLDAAAALVGAGPVRRDLRVALHRERALAFVALGSLEDARQALLVALEAAGTEASLADPVRAALATVDLMADSPRAAQARLAERGRDRVATLVAHARLHLYQGATALAESALQACEQAPGGSLALHPPTAVLRSLVALWDGRLEQARVLYDGVGTAGNPYWEMVRALLLRAFWAQSGDGRYLQLAGGTLEELRFGGAVARVPGLAAAAAAQHAVMLALTGHAGHAVEVADEALDALGALGLPEWPRAAILHDLAMIYREAGRAERWQRVLDLAADVPRGVWPERLRQVTGPRAHGALDGPQVATTGAPAAGRGLMPVALRLLDDPRNAEASLLRGLSEALGAHGARWRDGQGAHVAAAGSGWSAAAEQAIEVVLPTDDVLALYGCTEASLAGLDLAALAQLTDAARGLALARAREAELRDALERAEARRQQAVDALERLRRGAAAAVTGGHFPTVAGRSARLRAALDKLGLLAASRLPVLLEGHDGSGRRHLARAFHRHLGGADEGCPILDVSLVPAETMISTLLRLEAEAGGGCYVVAHAEHLTPQAASWLVARLGSGEARGRALLTLGAAAANVTADALRKALVASRVEVPSLDERLEDLPQLIDALAVTLGKRPEHIGTGARSVLARRPWPGQVAELRDLLARAALRAGDGTILPEHLQAAEDDARKTNLSEHLELGYHDAVKEFRRQLLRHALHTTGGNRTHAAELLGVQRTYFMRLIRDLGADDIPPAN